MKYVKLTAVVYEMLIELAKKNRQKPEEYVEATIKSLYQSKR